METQTIQAFNYNEFFAYWNYRIYFLWRTTTNAFTLKDEQMNYLYQAMQFHLASKVHMQMLAFKALSKQKNFYITCYNFLYIVKIYGTNWFFHGKYSVIVDRITSNK